MGNMVPGQAGNAMGGGGLFPPSTQGFNNAPQNAQGSLFTNSATEQANLSAGSKPQGGGFFGGAGAPIT
jgi:hypothetical protein